LALVGRSKNFQKTEKKPCQLDDSSIIPSKPNQTHGETND
jgi:hypothetical protein